MGRHPYHDVPSEKRGDPRGGETIEVSREVAGRMCQRLSLECRAAAQDVQRAARARDDDALEIARTSFHDALAREEEWYC